MLSLREVHQHVSISVITCDDAIKMNKDSNVKAFANGVVIGSRVTYTCKTGYKRETGSATCECLATGKWSCRPPKCARKYQDVKLILVREYIPLCNHT